MNTWAYSWDATMAKSCWLWGKPVAFSVFVHVHPRVSAGGFMELGLRCYLTKTGRS